MKQTKTIGVQVDPSNPDLTWKNLGYTGWHVNATYGNVVTGHSGMKIQVHDPLKPGDDPFLVVAQPKKAPFIPHEAVSGVVYGLPKRVKDTFPERKDFAIEYVKEKFAHGGRSAYWLVQTNQQDTFKSHINDDRLKFGFSIRNGYSTGVALGIDLFSFRLVCKNGAISRGNDFGTVAIRHVGKDPKYLLKLFEERLMLAVEGWTSLLDLYKKMAQIKLNNKMAEYIYSKSWIADKYYPDYYQITPTKELKKNPKKPVVALTAQGKSVTLWENFNDLTGDVWHAHDSEDPKHVVKKPISYYSVAQKETRLHGAINTIVNNKELFTN